MVQFDPNTLYSIKELAEALHGVVELATLLERLGLRENRVFRDAVWGWEIIDAARRAKPFAEAGKPDAAQVASIMAGPRSSRPRRSNSPTRKLGAADLYD